MIIPGALLEWVNRAIPHFHITNFGTDWRDGKALCALINYLKPGLLDPSKIHENDPFANVNTGIETAKEHLQIPSIIEASDMLKENPDDFAIITYLSFLRYYDIQNNKAEFKFLYSPEEDLPEDSAQETNYEPETVDSAKVASEIEQFEAEMEKFEAQLGSECISEEVTSNGGVAKLEDGASLKVLPGSSLTGNTLSIESPPPDVIEACARHDTVEGSVPVAMLNCLPHGEEFAKPVLLNIPYDPLIPIEKLAVFHMQADQSGKPCGTWTLVEEAKFTGSVAVILTTHFSLFSVMRIDNMDFHKKAKLRRSKNKFDVIFPGLTFRGPCKKPNCEAHNKSVNCSLGFVDIDVSEEVLKVKEQDDSARIKCPFCKKTFMPDKLVIHDTVADISYEISGNAEARHEVVNDASAVCLGIKRASGNQNVLMSDFKIKCTARPESCFGIDICFVIDCTGSMGQYIQAAHEQTKAIANSLKEGVEKLGMTCKLRIGFVGYRDFIVVNNVVETPSDLLCTVPFTEDVSKIVEEIASQDAYGGDDTCEHLLGGLNEAVELKWEGSMRAIILIADAPCHGDEFHSPDLDDSFKTGVDGYDARDIITKMLEKNINLFFLKVCDNTDVMAKKFQSFFNTQKNTRGVKLNTLNLMQEVNIMGTLIQAGIMQEVSGLC